VLPESKARPVAGSRPKDLRRRATAGAIWASLEILGQQLLQLALFAALARMLGPEAYGLVGLAAAVTVVPEMLITSGGWAEALIRHRHLEPEHLDTVFWFALATSSALALMAAAAAEPVAQIFGEPQLESLVRWLSLTMPAYSLAVVPSALLRRELRFAPYTARAVLTLICAGTVSILMAFWGFGVWSLLGYHLTLPVVAAVVLWQAHPWRPAFRFSLAHLRQLLPYVSGSMGERALAAIDNVLPRIVIGYALGAVSLGYYTLARRVVELLFQLATAPVTRVAMPSFASVTHDPERLCDALQFGAKVAGLVAFPCLLGAAVVAPDLIPAVFGPEWGPSAQLIQLLALMGLAAPFNQLSAALMQSIGRVGWQAALMAASVVLMGLLLALVGTVSVTAVASALLARACLMFPARLRVVHGVTGIDVAKAYRGALPTLAAALLMAGAVLLWRRWLPASTDVWLSLASSVAVGVGVYATAAVVLAWPLLRQAARLLFSLWR
jgi:O-antigen/teichoic acid export membrane protein